MSIRKQYDTDLESLKNSLTEMGRNSADAVENALEALCVADADAAAAIVKEDARINNMERDIEHRCMTLLLRQQPVAGDLRRISTAMKVVTDIERIGDHAMNICEYTQMLDKKKIQFSEEAQEELRTMEAVCLEVLDLLEQESIEPTDWLTKVSALEQRMDDMTEEYRRNQMKRMKQGSCSDEACIIFSELLTDFERIGDHALNIAQERAGIATEATDA